MDNAPQKSSSFFFVALNFIRKNPSIILSLALMVFMPLALYFNTYILLNTYEKNAGIEFMRKAAMVENTLDAMIDGDLLNNPESLEKKINEIKEREDEIADLEILMPSDEKRETYDVIASFAPDQVGQKVSEDFYKTVAWSQPEGTSHFEDIGGARVLKIEKVFHDDLNSRIGLLSLSFSMQKTDNMISQAFLRSYLILFVTILLVLVFVINHARMFRYAVRLAKLKEVDEMKDNFISIASHELRSPLTAMRGYLEFLKEKEVAHVTEEGKHYIDNLETSVDRLDNLVSDLLEVSRLEQNRIPFEMKIIDLASAIKSGITEMEPKAQEKNLEITYSEAPLPRVRADQERLKQVFINLISNAIKYTPKGKIEITAKTKRKQIDIIISDTGLGISAENQKKLFQKFYRARTKETSAIPGTGLGLWITKELIEKMNGTIGLESIEGVGSRFTVSFPIAEGN
ncbi:MAG: HAMP domain-containing sensor histidine kinase [Parcubacteria group bacterium]|jgi:signal transduction histidine kinase